MLKNLTAIIAGTLIALATGPVFAQGNNVGSAILDLGDDLATLQETVDSLQELVQTRTIFVSSLPFTGDLVQEAFNLGLGDFGDGGGLLAADALCQFLADAEDTNVPEASYMALLSATFPNGEGQIRFNLSPSIGPYVRSDGRTVAPNVTALLSTGVATQETLLFVSPNRDEFGIFTEEEVWTGSFSTGRSTSTNCSDWDKSDSGIDGRIGDNDSIDGDWLDSGAVPCDNDNHLYCVMG